MTSGLRQLEELYRDLAPVLLGYFRRRPALAGAAEDLLHDTFVRALERRERLAVSVSARAYVFGIARHVGSDALRGVRPTEEFKEMAAATAAEPDERVEAMHAAIESLPEPQRETLRLRLREELSYEEIAEVLDVPIGTVRSRLHGAVRRLQEILNPSTNEPSRHDETGKP